MARSVRLLAVLAVLGAALATLPAVSSHQHAFAAPLETVTDCSSDDGFDAALANVDYGGTIEFDCGMATIIFDGQKQISKTVTVDGGGQITLDGDDSTRLFTVYGFGGGNLMLENITLANGNEGGSGGIGGAIYNIFGTLTVTNATFSGNSAGGLGGAIYNDGTLTITSSTIVGNSADTGGGAIFNDGTLNITNATFSGNSAGDDGGAIFNSGTLTVTSSTIVGNSAAEDGGAILNNSGTLTITSSTIVGNSAGELGGAIYGLGTTTITASILVDNGDHCFSTAFSGGYNLVDETSCNFASVGDIQNGDANLGPLADNGGPTETMLPITPSDAIDAIPNSFCSLNLPASDQRGVARPQLDACDIGAVEVQLSDFPEQSLCANRYNGDLRMPRTPSCASTEILLTLPDDGPLNVCVNRYNGDASYSRTGACALTETAIQVQGIYDQPACVNRYNGDIRVPRVEGQCASTEIARLI